jgi:tetratricopeptide (TPR) repeat protein
MKKIYFVITLLFVFAGTTLLKAQNVEFKKANFPGKEKEFKVASRNVTQGKKYYNLGRGMYLMAIEYFLKAQTFNPNNAELNYLIGNCYLNTVQKTKSIEFFEKSIDLSPNQFKDIKYLLAQAYQLQLDFDKAITLFGDYKSTLSPAELNLLVNEINKKILECNNGKELVKNPVRVFIDNLGSQINTIYPEYSPFTNADESQLFFTSRRPNTTGGKIDENDKQYFEDIYISEKISGQWTEPKNPSSPLNSKQHDAPVGLSPDGQTLLIYKGTNGGDIYECKLKGTSWSAPKKLNKNINTPDHESSGSISFDGKTLYFVSNKPKGYGGSDIYVSNKTKKGDWGKPVNIGPTINTPYDEEGVFIHPDGRTLYFSSK